MATSELKSKRDRIEFLLEHYLDFYATMDRSETLRGDPGGSLKLMPAMSRHPSVMELDRAILATRTAMPVRYNHMKAYYTAEWRTVNRAVRKKAKGGKFLVVDERVRERLVPRWVRLEKVRNAVDCVTETFEGEVFIPAELMEVAA